MKCAFLSVLPTLSNVWDIFALFLSLSDCYAQFLYLATLTLLGPILLHQENWLVNALLVIKQTC